MSSNKIRSWEVLSTREIYAAEPWLKLSLQSVRLPGGLVVPDYHKIELPDFALIFAETSEGKVVVERQYKHGVGRTSLMLPAGALEPGEEPLAGAKRELVEETGYAAPDWEVLTSFVLHGNYGCGRAHLFKVRNAKQVAAPNSGDLEDIEIVLMQREDVLEAVRSGEVALLGSAALIAIATNPLLTEAGATGERT